MRWIDKFRTSTLAIMAGIMVLTAFTILSPYIPGTRIQAQQVGPGGVPGAGGGGASVSITSSTGDLTVSPSPLTGTGTIDLNLGSANTWTGAQTFGAGATFSANEPATFLGVRNWTITALSSGSDSGLQFSTSGLTGPFWDMQSNGAGWSNFGLVGTSTASIGWAPGASANTSADTGFSRKSAGVISVNSGTYPSPVSNGKGSLYVASIIPGVLYSAAGTALPSCASGLQGETAVVSDATSPTYMGAYTSGGGITAAVICSYDGTTYSWLTH